MPRNNADFHNLSYILTSTHPTSHELEAFDAKSNSIIGYMRWHKKTGQVQDIQVDKEHRRKGVATGMWNYAKSLSSSDKSISTPKHSPVRTSEGDSWANSVGA